MYISLPKLIMPLRSDLEVGSPGKQCICHLLQESCCLQVLPYSNHQSDRNIIVKLSCLLVDLLVIG